RRRRAGHPAWPALHPRRRRRVRSGGPRRQGTRTDVMDALGGEGSAGPAAPGPGALLILDRMAVGPPGGGVLLSEVNLQLGAGECIALVGPSGAGKTTLLRVLNGQI